MWPFVGYGVVLAIWGVTLVQVVRSQSFALSTQSQTAWMFFLIFFPILGVPFYWLREAPRRRAQRSGPPPG